jgi:integrase
MARHFHRAVKDAGLPDTLRFHDLRHTCAAILIAQGWAAKQIQDRLGHASIRTTLDRYGHLFEGHDAALLDRLDGLLRATEASHVDSVLTLPSKVAALDAKQGAKKAP